MNDTEDDVFGVKANNRSYESKGIQSVANITFGNKIFNDLEIGLRYHEDYEDRFQWVDKYAIQNQEMIRTTVARKGSDSNVINSAEAFAGYVLYKFTHNDLTITPGLRYENITLKKKDYGKNDSDRTGSDLSRRGSGRSSTVASTHSRPRSMTTRPRSSANRFRVRGASSSHPRVTSRPPLNFAGNATCS